MPSNILPSFLRALTAPVLGAFFLASQVSAQGFELDQFEQFRDIIKNPERIVTQEEADQLRMPGNNQALLDAAKAIGDDTRNRVDEELQRLEFDEQTWLFERDENAEVTSGGAFGNIDQTQSSLGSPGDVKYVVYLSLGMPKIEFQEAMRAIKERDDAFGVIVGLIDPDHSIPDTMLELYQLWTEQYPGATELPLIYMDPNLFTDYGVDTVPTVIRFDGKTPTLKVPGMLNIGWVESQFGSGRTGAMAPQGPTYEIAEEHFMETVQRRMAALDEEQMKQDAYNRFWQNQRFEPLPPAEETGSFMVDLTFTVQQDIQLPSGEYVARRGQKVNPLEIMPFPRIGIIFDGSDEEQIAWAQREVDRAKRLRILPIVMITDLNIAEDGWEAFETLNDSIPGFPVTLANRPVLDRFQVEKVPSRFEQEGLMIRVTEFAREDYR